MVLTSATQEMFGCRADEDVTGDAPYKLLRKADVLQDMRTRAAVSDFSPVKQLVMVSPGPACHWHHADNVHNHTMAHRPHMLWGGG